MTNGIRVGSADIERHAALVERLNLLRRKSGALERDQDNRWFDLHVM